MRICTIAGVYDTFSYTAFGWMLPNKPKDTVLGPTAVGELDKTIAAASWHDGLALHHDQLEDVVQAPL